MSKSSSALQQTLEAVDLYAYGKAMRSLIFIHNPLSLCRHAWRLHDARLPAVLARKSLILPTGRPQGQAVAA